jgi:bacterioferritin B
MYAPMSDSRFIDAVNEQIGYELAASNQYVAIAVYFDSETLQQLAAHFYRQALEERNHAMMLVQYLLDSGETVRIPAVVEPQNDFPEAIAPVALALQQERTVTDQIVRLAALAREENDLVGAQFMDWFLKEQREEVASMSALLAVVERASENLFLAEEHLSRNQIGDAGVDPTAPPAAGGAL